jgi:MFS family permease
MSDVASMYVGGQLADRLGRLTVLLFALSPGSIAVLVTSGVHSAAPFAALCLALGIPIGVAWVVPAAMAADVAESAETGLASYRICADIGLGAGGILPGSAVASLGMHRALLAATALLIPAVLAPALAETRRRVPTVAAMTGGLIFEPDLTHRPATKEATE